MTGHLTGRGISFVRRSVNDFGLVCYWENLVVGSMHSGKNLNWVHVALRFYLQASHQTRSK